MELNGTWLVVLKIIDTKNPVYRKWTNPQALCWAVSCQKVVLPVKYTCRQYLQEEGGMHRRIDGGGGGGGKNKKKNPPL